MTTQHFRSYMSFTASKTYSLAIVICLSGVLDVRVHARSLDEWNVLLSDPGSSRILDVILRHQNEWPQLSSIPEINAVDRAHARELASTVLTELNIMGSELARSNQDIQSVLEDVKIALGIADMARSKGGYINELISVNSENVGLMAAWRALGRSPVSSADLIASGVARPPAKSISPAEWWTSYYKLDSWLVDKPERVAKLTHQTDPAAIDWILFHDRKPPVRAIATDAFSLIDQPYLPAIWSRVEANDFVRVALLPAAIEFVQRGGVLATAAPDRPTAVLSVFGTEGLGYSHRVRAGKIFVSDIWISLDLYERPNVRATNVESWFGK